ncbi:MAG: NADH-quinone oxidoreductase subunit L [Nitrospinae bacterium]|nr:NADH-quinone oxidoreductase subunit L [Nitrospinota bacterium]
MSQYVWLIPLFPILAVLINGLFGRKYIRDKAHYLAVGSVGLSLLVAIGIFIEVAFLGGGGDYILYPWIFSGQLSVNVGFLVDPLSAIMLMVVCGVGFLIHVYSVGYMHGDGGYYRFFTYLNLFMFSMLILVLGDNYLVMFVGWEGVGLCSYLLIGFWFEKRSAADAGKKAFIVNRIGDAGFLLGIFLIFAHLGGLDYHTVFANAHNLSTGVATAITLCLFLGAMGKSAQLPLYVWLPDAMEGPTPVSALIHAATMVTAGVYMVARSNALFMMAPVSMATVALVGAATAIFAASIGLVQNDIKRVLAYSTVSQLGYMFLACGVGAFAAGIFHLMTHAFFKALLFLGSGSVIHGMSGEQDMRKMGGLRRHMPITFLTFAVATIAIAGIPPFAGFFSKDEILWQAFSSPHGHIGLWLIGAVAAGMTAFYMSRLVFMTFFGESRVDEHAAHHLHESPRNMTVPLSILAVLSVVGGWVGIPQALGGSNRIHAFLAPVLGGHGEAAAHGAVVHHPSAVAEYGLMLLSVAIALGGIGLAYQMYLRRPELPARLAQRFPGVYAALSNKYWVDEVYLYFIVNPIKRLTRSLWKFDANLVDGAVNGAGWLTLWNSFTSGRFDLSAVDGAVNGVGTLITAGGKAFRRLHTGLVQNYALAMFLGIFVLVSIYWLS